ncbi:putative ABC transporter [Rhypophila decipiens]
MSLSELLTQVKALTKKNLRLLVTRHWLATLLQAVVAPILILALTLNINNFSPTSQKYGFGDTRPIRSIKDSIKDSQRLVFVKPPHLGSDVSEVIQTIASSLRPEQVFIAEDQDTAGSKCPLTWRGVSNCYATITFNDSPQTKGLNKTWNYSLRFDPARSYAGDNVHSDDGTQQIYYLPTQLAVENAITNSTEVPLAYQYTAVSQESVDNANRIAYGTTVITTYVIAFFLSVLPTIYHVVGVITGERESGISHLVDAMGGSPSARVLSYIASFSIVYFPTWLIMGCLYWALLLRESNAAIPIFWQIFSGLAMLNASIFAASFFSRRRISSIFTCVCFMCLAGGAAILINKAVPTPTVIGLSLFFPSMNYIFVTSHMAVFALGLVPVDLGVTRVEPVEKDNPFQYEQTYFVAVWTFWLFLVIQIILYAVLAILVERWYHGISFKNRKLSTTTADANSPAIQTNALGKVYHASWYKRVFGRKDGFTALDGVELVAEKNQILCLLGINGAGKSTTLDLLSGLQSSTRGDVVINAGHSQLGICPQKNVLFDRLTVLEHVRFWSEIKGERADIGVLNSLIEGCDLSMKMHSRASTLSGGQKRKLQLACMFAGGTTVCLMDEVTTGLDPISRRTIWNIILAERSKRSMVFTTHFLDEGEVLADHIIILSKGRIKCQGTGTELKNRFGGGYRVHVPKEAYIAGIEAHRTVHQDRIVYRTPDSKSAAALVAQMEAAGCYEAQMAGPTIEDVFLGVAEEDVTVSADAASSEAAKMASIAQLSPGKHTSFGKQLKALLKKRLRVLPRYWTSTFLALALPIACIPGMSELIGLKFMRPNCNASGVDVYPSPIEIWAQNYDGYVSGSGGMDIPFGPASANETLYKVMQDYPIAQNSFDMSLYDEYFHIIPGGFGEFQQAIRDSVAANEYKMGGVWVGGKGQPPTFAFQASGGALFQTMALVNLYTSVTRQVKIALSLESVFTTGLVGDVSGGFIYIIYAALLMVVYPAFFALYPAFEKTSNVRALQYSNGVRPLPLWTSYFLFDLIFVLLVSVAYTATISVQFPYWWGVPYMFPVCLLFGITGIFVAYIISSKASSQLSSFLWTLALNFLGYLVMALATILPMLFSDAFMAERNNDIVSYVLGLVFPIGNIFRAMAAGLNQNRIACRDDGSEVQPGSWFGYGLPITYLLIQVIVLGALLVWMDSDLTFSLIFSRAKHDGPGTSDGGPGRSSSSSSMELATRRPSASHATPAVDNSTSSNLVSKEATRVTASQSKDLLRIVHISKSFDGKTYALDDVSLGLGEGEILALLGPNGAGKTTLVNLIRGELAPEKGGDIYLRDINTQLHPREAQKSIGVCPQFDALDLLTVKQHLEFYAAIKGLEDVKGNVDTLMTRIGLSEFSNRLASKLSGGNKRKLSLAIALMGNPDVLILDEPSSSMDAAAKRRMWKLLEEVAAPGRSLLLTTHSMEEADHLATRAAILNQKLLAIGTTQQLRREYSNLYHVQLVLKTAPHSGVEEMGRVEDWVRSTFGGANVKFEGASLGGQVKFMVPVGRFDSSSGGQGEEVTTDKKGRGVGHVIELLEANRDALGLQDYSVGAPTLERVFLSVVKDSAVEEDGDPGRLRKRRWGIC